MEMYNLALINGFLFQVAEENEYLLQLSSEQFAALNLSWTTQYTWDGTTFTPVEIPPPQPPTLVELKQAKMAQLNANLYAVLENGYQGQYRAHEENQAQYARQLQLFHEAIRLQMMDETDTVSWFGKQGMTQGTVTEYSQFMVAYGFWVQTKYQLKYTAEIAINEATTEELLNAVDISLEV
jgi:hypothetical protein